MKLPTSLSELSYTKKITGGRYKRTHEFLTWILAMTRGKDDPRRILAKRWLKSHGHRPKKIPTSVKVWDSRRNGGGRHIQSGLLL